MSGWMIALRLTGLGWYMGLSIVLGVLGGIGLDNWMGSSPLFLILGVGFGVVVGFYGIYKMVLPLLNETDNDEGTS
jgi:F0F1-type ATP synthase assembly protein I